MTTRTHILIAASGGAAVAEVSHASGAAGVVLVAAALAANGVPDKDRHAQRDAKRSATHWLVTGFVFALLAGVLVEAGFPGWGSTFRAGFLTGYWLHLLADALTPEGCPLFGPLFGPVRLLPFRLRIVSGRPKKGWTGSPYVPIPEPFAAAVVVGLDVLFLLPHLAG
jgi:membrane-bound metal-dependent hydrolase YbcI (DUF457 family)